MNALSIGQVVSIFSGMTGHRVATGTVERISPTGKVVKVRYTNERVGSFYRQSGDSCRYVKDPGCGIGGSFLNDYFRA